MRAMITFRFRIRGSDPIPIQAKVMGLDRGSCQRFTVFCEYLHCDDVARIMDGSDSGNVLVKLLFLFMRYAAISNLLLLQSCHTFEVKGPSMRRDAMTR